MKPKIKTTCTKLQLQLLSFCLLCLSGKTRCDGNGPAVVTVKQDSDAVLPCSLSSKENIELYLFDWKKPAQIDGRQKEVFFYDAGITYDSGRAGQSEEFKGRVSHFPEELKHGNASIIIRNTMVPDSGNYTCVFPRLQPPQTFHIELVVEPVVVAVEEDGHALLPCSLSTKENIEQGHFDWNKLAQNDEKQKEVFLYLNGRHSNNGFGSQDEEFKRRVSHFQEELKDGNASIIIKNTKMADSGNYTCTFTEPRQTFHIELVVAKKPSITALEETKDWSRLQCEVHGASPKPKVEWKNSSGNILPAEEPQVTDRGGSYDIILQTTVTKTDYYHCVVTQEEIKHQTEAKIHVYISDGVLKDRSDENIKGGVLKNRLDENIPGAAPKPNIRTLDQTDNRALLQCEANGHPQPEVEWRDSAGNKLPPEEPQVSERDGRFYVTLNTAVTKTDRYRCVATQKTISHQIHDETFVRFNGPAVVTVKQDSAAVLPCSLSSKEDIEFDRFDWKKPAQIDGGQKKVFYYDAGITYDSGRAGQSEEFKGRVSHFPEELKHGNAAIIIRNTTVADSGDYTCNFPDLQPRQTFHIELVVEPVVKVEEDRDALLPCSLRTKGNIEQGYFTWDKVPQNNENQKEVFLYDKGKHSPSYGSQDDGFKGRVSHFEEELKHGNASIIIRNTTVADSGNYTCTFTEPRQTFHIELVVGPVLKDRSDKNIRGAAKKPSITTLEETKDWSRLQCEVQGASPKPKVQWKDSSGNILPAEEPQVTDRGGSYDIILQTTVTRANYYHCVVTQEDINHQTEAKIHVYISDAASKPNIRTLDETDNRALLQCEVHGNPQPEVEWRDSAGKKLPAEEPQVSERDGRFFVTLNTAVTNTDHYQCVATQKDISHQIYAETFVRITGSTGRIVVVSVICTLLVVIVVLAVLVYKGWITLHCNKGSPADPKEGSAVPLNGRHSRSQEAPHPETKLSLHVL